MKKIIIMFLTITAILMSFTACTNSEIVNYNLNKEADKFNVYRRITVTNARTDTIMMQVEGYMSLSNNSSNELVVTVRTGEDVMRWWVGDDPNQITLEDYMGELI